MAGATESVDVVVVGAGLAGLATARDLERRGHSTVILEAGREIGGHTRSRLVDGQVIDLGGEHVSTQHARVHALARELGLTLEPTALAGAPRMLWRLDSRPRVSRIPPASPSEYFFGSRAALRIERLARDVPPRTPWEGRRA